MDKTPTAFKKAKKHPGGRPTKLTPKLQKTIVSAIVGGNYIETASAMAGINKETLYRWLKEGARSEGGIQHEFSNAVQKAIAKAEIIDVRRVGVAARTQWQAAAWRLERKHPDRWGRREKVEHSGPDGGPISLTVKEMSDADLLKIAGQKVKE